MAAIAHIQSLPVEDTVWFLEINEEDSQNVIVRIVDKCSFTLAFREIDIENVSYSDEIYSLVCTAVLNPKCGKPRKPRYFTFKDDRHGKVFDVDLRSKLGITCLYDSDWRERGADQCYLTFRECSYCHLRATKDLFITCPHCGAVLYCNDKCLESDKQSGDHSHRKWCQSILGYMSEAKELMDFPFTFTTETSAADFDCGKYRRFLERLGVYNQGLWRREVQDTAGSSSLPFGTFLHTVDSSSYILPVEDTVLQEFLADRSPRIAQDWLSYYKLRGLSLDSPVAVLLQWPLTLYWILTVCLPRDYGVNLPLNSDETVIHMLGVEKEADIFSVFKEVGYLLPGMGIHIHMFGRKISKALDGKVKFTGQVKVTFHRKLYHKVNHPSNPALVIGFNAGLAAYPSWIPTIVLLQRLRVPCYFTDYCRQSIDMASSLLHVRNLNSSVCKDVPNMACEIPRQTGVSCTEESECNFSSFQCIERSASTKNQKDQSNLLVQSDTDTKHNSSDMSFGSFTAKEVDLSMREVSACLGNVTLSDPVINLFRSPIRLYCADHNVPCYSNAYLFHLKYN